MKLLEIFSVDFFLSPKPISMKLLVVMPTLAAEWHQIDFRLSGTGSRNGDSTLSR